MARSIRQGILACLLVLVGLALWQAYQVPAQTGGSPPRTMTLDDDGEELKCRLVRLSVQDGVRIYELEVIGTGEKIRAAEDTHVAHSGRDRKFAPLRILQRERGATAAAHRNQATRTEDSSSLHNSVVQGSGQPGRRFVMFPNLRAAQNARRPHEAPAANEDPATRLADRVANRLSGQTSEEDGTEVSRPVDVPRLEPVPIECILNRKPALPIANRLSRIMPSGRPQSQDRLGPQPGPMATALVYPPSEADPRPAAKGILPRLALRAAGGDKSASVVPAPVPIGEVGSAELVRPQEASPSVIFGASPLASMAATPAPKAPTKTLAKAPTGKPSSKNRLPAGSGSVLASKNGLPTPVAFVPVPIVTVPDPYRRPSPPMTIPQPPQANWFINGFTSAQMGARPPQGQKLSNGVYLPAPPAQQYAQANYPHHYSGPMPPYPNQQTQAAHWYAVPTYLHSPSADPHMLPPTARTYQAPEPMKVDQLVTMLKDSPYPSQRELAAKMLSAHDARTQPQIVSFLTEAAQKDPAASVRAGCVNSLAHMRLPADQLATALAGLRNDTDPRVRQEVVQAMGQATTRGEEQMIRPVSQRP